MKVPSYLFISAFAKGEMLAVLFRYSDRLCCWFYYL